MRVDGRDIGVSGNLLQPLTRRTNDIIRAVLAAIYLVAVITSSLITRPQWVALEKSISEIVGVLSPSQSDLVYLGYGLAILALPFVISDWPDRFPAVEAAGRVCGRRTYGRSPVVDQQ